MAKFVNVDHRFEVEPFGSKGSTLHLLSVQHYVA